MQEAEKHKEILIRNAEQILKALKNAGGNATSWELKLKLRMSGSALYLALGRLEAEGKITLLPEDLNLRVSLNKAEKKA